MLDTGLMRSKSHAIDLIEMSQNGQFKRWSIILFAIISWGAVPICFVLFLLGFVLNIDSLLWFVVPAVLTLSLSVFLSNQETEPLSGLRNVYLEMKENFNGAKEQIAPNHHLLIGVYYRNIHHFAVFNGQSKEMTHYKWLVFWERKPAKRIRIHSEHSINIDWLKQLVMNNTALQSKNYKQNLFKSKYLYINATVEGETISGFVKVKKLRKLDWENYFWNSMFTQILNSNSTQDVNTHDQ